VRALEEGNADLLVCYGHIDLPLDLDKERFPSLLLSEDKLVPVSRPGAHGQALHALRPQASCPVPWLSYSAEAFLGRTVALALEGQAPRLPLQAVLESALVEALRAAAKAGMGVAWLPANLVAADLASGRLVRAGAVNLDVPLQVRVFGNRATLTGDRRALWQAAHDIAEQEAAGAAPAMNEVCA
jgi:DNA-binding transcriptional LysR family regulator